VILKEGVMGILRMVLAFLCGIVVYWIGFFIGSLAGDVAAAITLTAPYVETSEVWAGGAAIAANAGAFTLFMKIYPNGKHKKAAAYVFVSILTVFAIVYAALCFFADQDYLLAYPIACIIPIIVMYGIVKRGEYEEVKDGQIHSDVS
jgi:hypothetical protein